MAMKFQYNKNTIQELNKQLAIREKALPILQNKETALRKEIKNRQKRLEEVTTMLQDLHHEITQQPDIWDEIPDGMIEVTGLEITQEKVVGVKIASLREVRVSVQQQDWRFSPAWFPLGVTLLRQALELRMEKNLIEKQLEILDDARKKTTQKVNLYEKIQIPEMNEAIRKIKRFLEDKENIAKAGQKIMKKKQENRKAA